MAVNAAIDESPPIDGRPEDEFVERLHAAMRDKGWTQAQTARAVSEHLAPGETFNAVNLSHYLKGRSRPGPRYRRALAKALALGDTPEMRAPPKAYRRRKTSTPGKDRTARQQAPDPSRDLLRVDDEGDCVRLQIDNRVPWGVALKVLDALKGPRS
jgi:transcriptional regulator with XRE-family HTH domain